MKAIKIQTINAIDLQYGHMVNDLTDKIIKSYHEQEDKIFINALRTIAIPPIKGEITKGKIKWRGIRLHQTQHNIFDPLQRQLFQRNKPISPIVTFDCKFITNDHK